MQKPKIVSQRIVAKSRIFTVESLELEFSNGNKANYERLIGSGRGAVLIVAVKPDNTFFLIREYSAGTNDYQLALPKGKIDAGESVIEAANRELKEEVGFGAKKLNHITSYTVAPGYLNAYTHVVLAQDLYSEKLEGDEPEELEVVHWNLNNLPKLFALPEVTEARSIAALYQVRDMLVNA